MYEVTKTREKYRSISRAFNWIDFEGYTDIHTPMHVYLAVCEYTQRGYYGA